jgi:hypothetical protein
MKASTILLFNILIFLKNFLFCFTSIYTNMKFDVKSQLCYLRFVFILLNLSIGYKINKRIVAKETLRI